MIARRVFLLLLGAVSAFLLAEMVLRLSPIPAGIAAADPSLDWPAHRLIPHSSYTSSLGWMMNNVQTGRINNAGYIAPFDYRDGANVGVVIGDSFVEGYMNPYGAMLQARLADALGSPRDQVYNFGSSGASLPHYLGVARLVGRRYAPRWAAVLITSGDFVEGFSPSAGFFGWSPRGGLIHLVPEKRRGLLADLLRRSALVRYARGNLRFNLANLFASGFAVAVKPCRRPTLSSQDESLVRAWRDDLPTALHLPAERIVLVFDSDRAVYRLGSRPHRECVDRDGLALGWLKAHAGDVGLRTVDTQPLFAAAWAADHQPLDRAPLDGHWNALGHAVVARAVAALIASMDGAGGSEVDRPLTRGARLRPTISPARTQEDADVSPSQRSGAEISILAPV